MGTTKQPPQPRSGAPAPPHRTTPLSARFASLDDARAAVRELGRGGLRPPGRVLVWRPPSHRGFVARRGRWGAIGAAAGALLGGGAAFAAFAAAGDLLLATRVGIALTGALIGALLVGTLGLVSGLALGEAKATAETSEDVLEGRVEGEVALRLEVSRAQVPEVRALLLRGGALEVRAASRHAPDR